MKKRIFTVLLMLLLLCSACGAEKEPESRSVSTQIGGQAAVVTFDPGTWSAGTVEMDKGTYTFAWDRSGDLKITYPDGERFTWKESGVGAASVGYDPGAKGYPDGLTMAWGIEDAIDQARGGGRSNDGPNPLLAIFLLAVGAWNAFAPRTAWYLSRGWQFRNAEPSDAALALHVITGGALMLAGVICLLAAIF